MSTETKYKARARIALTCEVDHGSVWPSGVGIDHIAQKSASETVVQLRGKLAQLGISIVGEPRVVVTIVEESP